MTDLEQQHAYVAVQLAGLIVQALQRQPPAVDVHDAGILLDNIADYCFAVAQDRIAHAICRSSAAELLLKIHDGQPDHEPIPPAA